MSQPHLTIIAKNYPNSILLGTTPYNLTFQIQNNSIKSEQYKFYFTAEGISCEIPSKYQNPIILESGKSYDFAISITPTVNGSAKLIVEANNYQEVKYTEMIRHIRKVLPQKWGKEALSCSFTKSKDLIRGVNKIPKFKNGKQLDVQSAAKEYEKVHASAMESSKKDQSLVDIAKRVFDADAQFSFEVIKMVQNQNLVQQLIADLVYAAVERDKNLSVSKLAMVQDLPIKDDLLVNLISYVLEKDMGLAIDLCKQIHNTEIRDATLRDIFYFSYLKRFDDAIQLISIVSDQKLQLALYYEMIKILLKTDASKCIALLQNLVKKSIFINESQILANLLLILAHLQSPQMSVEIINTLPAGLKEQVNKDILNALWEQVEEVKVRIDEVPSISLYYAFNVMVKPTPVISKISELGGTVSENLINGEMNSVIGIVNLFSFNFPVYPTIEQSYAEIKKEKGKSFYYLIIPLKNAEEETYQMAQSLIKSLFVTHAGKVPYKMYIFNLDFIPYLSKPTIIVGDDPEENIVIQSITKRVFKDKVSLIIDDGLFKDGKITNWIKSILPENKFKLLNMVLTYDFLNNYQLFKDFMTEFVR